MMGDYKLVLEGHTDDIFDKLGEHCGSKQAAMRQCILVAWAIFCLQKEEKKILVEDKNENIQEFIWTWKG